MGEDRPRHRFTALHRQDSEEPEAEQVRQPASTQCPEEPLGGPASPSSCPSAAGRSRGQRPVTLQSPRCVFVCFSFSAFALRLRHPLSFLPNIRGPALVRVLAQAPLRCLRRVHTLRTSVGSQDPPRQHPLQRSLPPSLRISGLRPPCSPRRGVGAVVFCSTRKLRPARQESRPRPQPGSLNPAQGSQHAGFPALPRGCRSPSGAHGETEAQSGEELPQATQQALCLPPHFSAPDPLRHLPALYPTGPGPERARGQGSTRP